jgi:hypothetical protein
MAVFHVGGAEAPERGSLDPDVLDHAMKCNQTVVTSNNDMVVLCCERSQSHIWLSGKGESLTLYQTVMLCFGAIEEWEQMLRDAKEPVCIRAMKTRNKALPLDVAKQLALGRAHRRKQRLRRRARNAAVGQGVLDPLVAMPPSGRLPRRQRQHCVRTTRQRPARRRYGRRRPVRRRR